MNFAVFQKDLIVLVADKNIEFALRGILTRKESLGIHEITYDIHVHPERDPGCYHKGVEFVRSFIRYYRYALLIFDHEGSGQESLSRQYIESQKENEFQQSGWDDRALAIVIDPELEVWIWNESLYVDEVLGWAGHDPSLREWLIQEGWLSSKQVKPNRPKEALESALRKIKQPRSSSIYQDIAEKVSLKKCIDPSFLRLKNVLIKWFQIQSSE